MLIISSFLLLIMACPSGEVLIRDRGYNENTIPHAMNYVNYNKAIVAEYGVELAGWTHDKLENPGNIKTGLALNTLLSALAQGVCYWRTLSSGEWETKKQAQDVLEKAGTAKKRKQRSDAGKTRHPQRTATGKTIQISEANQARPRKKQKNTTSARMVDNSDDEDQDDDDEQDHEQDHDGGEDDDDESDESDDKKD